ncbi:MAG: hypothetical protein JXB07_02480 [Anaerolineae bacterium]|nr:hypothetical protein [Anaerolineae bacterium]
MRKGKALNRIEQTSVVCDLQTGQRISSSYIRLNDYENRACRGFRQALL